MAFRQGLRGRAIAAADVADGLARGEVEAVGNEIDQCLGRLVRRFRARSPIAVMDVLAPDLAVEGVELVIVRRHRGGGLGAPRQDHAGSADQEPVSTIETATAVVSCTATRSPGLRAAANSRIAGFTSTRSVAPSGVLNVTTPVVGS